MMWNTATTAGANSLEHSVKRLEKDFSELRRKVEERFRKQPVLKER